MTAYEMRISDWSSDVCSSDLFDLSVAADERVIIGVRNLGRVIGMIERSVVRDLGRERGERCGGVFVGFGQGGHAQALRKRERVIKLLERFDLPSLQDRKSTRLNSSH